MEKVIHVANNPWLKSGTIKDNILFGSPLVQSNYDRIVRACGLQDDFHRLPREDFDFILKVGDAQSNLSSFEVRISDK